MLDKNLELELNKIFESNKSFQKLFSESPQYVLQHLGSLFNMELSQNSLRRMNPMELVIKYKHYQSILSNKDKKIDDLFCSMHQALVRYIKAQLYVNNILENKNLLIKYLYLLIAYEKLEQFRVMLFNAEYKFLAEQIFDGGGIDHVNLEIREILAGVMKCPSRFVVVAHNHPSGNLTPSKADIEITRQLEAVCRYNKIILLDHLIISRNGHYSFADSGTMNL